MKIEQKINICLDKQKFTSFQEKTGITKTAKENWETIGSDFGNHLIIYELMEGTEGRNRCI